MAATTKTINKLLTGAGTIQILLGMAHFTMPGLLFKSPGFQQLSTIETDMVTLCIVSVGILLIALGFVSLICAVKYEVSKQTSLLIISVLTLLWFVRIIFEILFPVRIPLLFISTPTHFVMPVMIVLCSILVSTVFLMVKDQRN